MTLVVIGFVFADVRRIGTILESLGANKLGEGFCIQQFAKSPGWDLECGDRILG